MVELTAALAVIVAAIGAVLGVAFLFRRVVEPNEVHIVQNAKGITAYGAGASSIQDSETGGAAMKAAGNSYFEWPSFLPFLGVQVKKLPLAVFQLDLNNYEAYDVGKVPFGVDVVAFFRIASPATAARRITTMSELHDQLNAILQGAVRTILAKHEIEEIMEDRSTFGRKFTTETKEQLEAWGVENVKNIELMDIRDGHESKTVSNIMAKKESLIDMQSRAEVAENVKCAEKAEIEARREVDIQAQQAEEQVGLRTAQKDQAVGIATEQARQQVVAEAKTTKQREMAVLEVEAVRTAEINKEAYIVAAAQEKETRVIKAEGEKAVTITVAEGNLAEQQRAAEGTLAVGQATAEAKRLDEMAVVSPQITLAQEIGENAGYQTYLVQIRGVEKDERVGVEQAKALQVANIKVIANTGTVTGGVDNVMELFSSKGGTAVGAAVEAFAQTEVGEELLGNVVRGNGAAL